MADNALRCIESDYPVLLGLAQALGVITVDGEEIIPCPQCEWAYIGYKLNGEPPAEGEPDTRQHVKDANGHKYVHINVRTPFSVGEAAAVLAQGSPEVAAALSQVDRFFITDAQGVPVMPEFPMRVFL